MFWRRVFFWLAYARAGQKRPRWDTGISPPELVAFCERTPAGRAIDLGCGTGTNVIFLARQGWTVTGVDFIARAVNEARRKVRQAGVEATILQGDATTFQAEPVNLVLDIGCLAGLDGEARTRYIHNLPGLLLPGGSFLLHGFLHPTGPFKSGLIPGDLALLRERFEVLSWVDSPVEANGRRAFWAEYRRGES